MFLKDYIGESLLCKKIHFTCNCIMNLDVTGIIKDYIISNNEVIWLVDTGNKIIKVGENTPKLKIEVL